MTPETRCSAGTHPAEGRVLDVESPRRDAIVDYLLGHSLNSVIDRDFADKLIAEHPHLPRLAIAAATWDNTAAQTMLDHGLRRFLVLGTGGFPIWARPSTLADLHEEGAQIVVIEHDPITLQVHNHIDRGAAADRADVHHLPAHRHHDLATEPAVARLLTRDAPLGILATGLLRPAGIPLAAILSLLDAAPAGSLAAVSQLADAAHGNRRDTHPGGLVALCADEGIPVAVEAPGTVDHQLRDCVLLADDSGLAVTADFDAADLTLRVALLTRPHPRTAHPHPARGAGSGSALRRTGGA